MVGVCVSVCVCAPVCLSRSNILEFYHIERLVAAARANYPLLSLTVPVPLLAKRHTKVFIVQSLQTFLCVEIGHMAGANRQIGIFFSFISAICFPSEKQKKTHQI